MGSEITPQSNPANPGVQNKPTSNPQQTSNEPVLPPTPTAPEVNSAPYKQQLETEALNAKMSVFHVAGLQFAVKAGYLSQEHADAIKAKVKDGSLRSDGLDLILTAAYRDPEQFKKSFGSSVGGNIAAVLRDMDDEIFKGLNSHSWSENKYYKPILEELASIEKNGLMVPEKPKPKADTNPNKPEPKPENKPDAKPEDKPETKPENKPEPKPQPSSEYKFTSATTAIKDLGASMIEIDKATPGADRLNPEKVKTTTQCVEQLHKQSPAISEKDLFYLGVYRMQLESQDKWKEKTPQERNDLFIKGVTKDEHSLRKAIEEGKHLASSMEGNLRKVKSGTSAYEHAQEGIDIFEAVKSRETRPAPQPVTTTNYKFSTASAAMKDLGASIIAMEKATPGPDPITSETIGATTRCIEEIDRKMPSLSEKDLFYLGFVRLKWEFQPSLSGKTAKEKNDLFIENISKSQDLLNKAIQEGRNEALKTESDLRKAKRGTPLYNEAQKSIAIFDAVESSGAR